MRRPNILIILTDQQRGDALGADGNDQIKTPHLDRLAREGILFDRHYVQNPVCMPSRISFLTGQYPSTLRITHMGVPVAENTLTLPEILRPYGHLTANIGKLHFLPHARRDHRDPHPAYGFEHMEISDEPGCYEDAYRAWVRAKAPEELDRISVGLPWAARVHREQIMFQNEAIVHSEARESKRAIAHACRSDLTHSAFVGEQTCEFLRQNRDRPFFCIAGFYAPHSPWIAPQEFLDLYQPESLSLPCFPPEVEQKRRGSEFTDELLRSARHGYYAQVSEIDHYVGCMLDLLNELGLAENTLVCFTSDHGEYLGEHLRWHKGPPGHECVSRVPLLVRWPAGIVGPGRTIHGIVEAVDVVPTLLEVAGVQVPWQVQGRSLLPTLKNQGPPERGSALLEWFGGKSLRTDRFRYIAWRDGRESLLDLDEPFGEYRDVAGKPEYKDDLADARKTMVARLVALDNPIPRDWPY